MDETTGNLDIDFSPVVDMATEIKSELVEFGGDILPVLAAIAGAILVIWLARWAFRKVKQWMGAGS